MPILFPRCFFLSDLSETHYLLLTLPTAAKQLGRWPAEMSKAEIINAQGLHIYPTPELLRTVFLCMYIHVCHLKYERCHHACLCSTTFHPICLSLPTSQQPATPFPTAHAGTGGLSVGAANGLKSSCSTCSEWLELPPSISLISPISPAA